jgi:hypothetical protein
MPNLLLGSNDQ